MATPQPPKWSGYTMPNGGMISPLTNPGVLSPTEMAGIVARHGSWEGYVRDANTYSQQYKQYADTMAEQRRASVEEYEASRAEKDARAVVREAENAAKERALAVRDAEFARLSGLKDQQYAGIEDAYNKNVEQIRQASSDGLISSGQRKTLLDQARASRDAARTEASSSYDAARGIARTNYEQRAATPTGIEQLIGAYRPIQIDTGVAAKPKESIEDMTARLQREAQQAFADTEARSAQIDKDIGSMQSMLPATDEVANKVATDLFKSAGVDPASRPEEFNNWVNEVKVFGPEAATQSWNKNVAPRIAEFNQAQAQMQPQAQVPKEQARRLAEELITAAGFSFTPETLEGWTNYLSANGLDNTIAAFENATNVSFGTKPFLAQGKGYTYDTAREIAKLLYDTAGYKTEGRDPYTGELYGQNFNRWVELARYRPIEETIEAWNKDNPNNQVSYGQFEDESGTTAGILGNLKKFLGEKSGSNITSNLDSILEKETNRQATLRAQNLADFRSTADAILSGNLYPSFFQPQQPSFQFPTGQQPAQQQPTQQPFYPEMGQFQPQETFQPGYQPQFQTPSATPLITQAERPTLDQAIQFIESGGMSPRAGAQPMQPLSPYDLGATFQTQAEPYFPIPEMGYTTPLAQYVGTGGEVLPVSTNPMGMREGGSVAQEAKGLASLGRGGDSMLVHMTPDEVAGLQSLATQMGGSLSVNPETGLPEANFFRKLLPFVAAIAAPYLAPFAGALGGAGLAGLLATGGTMLGGGSFKQGLRAGLGAYGAAALTSNMMGSNPLGAGGQESTFNLANTFGTAATPGAAATPGVAEGMGGVSTGAGTTFDPESLAAVPQQAPIQQAGLTPPPTKPGMKILGMEPSTALLAGTLLTGADQAAGEQKRFAELNRQEQAEIARRQALGQQSYTRSGLGQIPMYSPPRTRVGTDMGGVRPGEEMSVFDFESEEDRRRRMNIMPAAGGGLIALAQGGMPTFEYGGTTAPTGEPRMVQGAGDGMSDNVPATIEGVQEARLANDEFVIPADVVADIGNGSSSAGAKKLYAMMDKIRSARHGTTEQPPEINAEKYMPV